jgi:hypothetical protein
MKMARTLYMKSCLLPLFLVMTGLGSLQAQVFVEKFTNTTGTGTNTGTIGWSSYYGSTAIVHTNDTSTYIAQSNQDRVTLAYASSNPKTDAYGFLSFQVSSTSTTIGAAAVTTFSSGYYLTNGSSISWTMGNTTTTATVRLLVQVNGSWYASSTAYSNATAISTALNFANATTSSVTYGVNFSTAASNWMSFTLTSGSVMSLGSALTSDLTSNVITGIGFYAVSDAKNTVIRLDSLTVVPEPSTYALFVLSLGLLFFRFRRHPKSDR